MRKLKPLGQRILACEVKAMAENTDIMLPEDAETEGEAKLAEVLAVGSPLEHIKVKKGDHVLLPSFAIKKVKFGGEAYWIAKLEDLLGVIQA